MDEESHLNEASLIQASLSGDGGAFAALVRPHLATLFRVAKRTESHSTLAEDAVQEALVIAFQRLGTYEPGTHLRAWLATIVVQRSRTLGRAERRRRHREARGLSVLAAQDTPLDAAEGSALRSRIVAILAEMPTRRREAVILRLDAGLTHGQIAQQLGSTEASIRVLLHLGLKTLRQALDDAQEDVNEAS